MVKTRRKFEAPETKDGSIWSRACDVYALGKTLACVADAAHASFKICEADTVFAELYGAMCANDPSERMNIDQLFYFFLYFFLLSFFFLYFFLLSFFFLSSFFLLSSPR